MQKGRNEGQQVQAPVAAPRTTRDSQRRRTTSTPEEVISRDSTQQGATRDPSTTREQLDPSQHQSQPTGITLRSGTTLPPRSQVSLNSYLNNLLGRARESGEITVSQCEALEKRLVETQELRLENLNKFKRETEKFKGSLKNFKGSSRPSELVKLLKNPNSVSLKEKGDKQNSESPASDPSLSECTESETSASEIKLNWLGNSLLESSHEISLYSAGEVSLKEKKMVDYAKVAKLTAQMVPLFSGESTPTLATDLQTFLGCCKQVKQCLLEEEQNAFLQILPTRLRGEAYQLVASITPTTFKEVEEFLNRTYLPRETYQELVNKLITLRQLPLEALTAFTTRIKQVLLQCYEAADAKYGVVAAAAVRTQLQDFAKNALRSGVSNPHLCQYLLTIGDDPLDVLIQKALDMERLQQTALNLQPNMFYGSVTSPLHQYNPPYTQPHSHQGASQRTATNLGQIRAPPAHLTPQANLFPNPYAQVPPSEPRNKFRQNSTPSGQRENFSSQLSPRDKLLANTMCNFCGKKGHTYSDCLKRKNTPFCTRCKVSGHDIRECKRPRDGPSPRPGQNPAKGNQRVYHVRLKCDFCGREGHELEKCPYKKKWEKKSPGNDSQSTRKSPARL